MTIATRAADTRPSAIPAGGSRTLSLPRSVVPAAAGAVLANVTALSTTSAGHLTVVAGGTTTKAPNTISLAFGSGRTVANLTAVQVSDTGTITVFNSSSKPVNALVDVEGWFRGSVARQQGLFAEVSPTRVLDTRTGTKATIASGGTRRFAALGSTGVRSADVSAVVLTVTATTTTKSGSISVFGGGSGVSLPPTLDFTAGETVSNLVVVPIASDGTVGIYNPTPGSLHAIADVTGFIRKTDAQGDVSHYIRSLTATQSLASITSQLRAIGQADAEAAAPGGSHVVLLQFGAQSAKAGGDGSGNGTAKGILQTATQMRITYAQVVAAVNGYVDGYDAGRGTDTSPVTVAVGTNTAGFAGASYTTAKGQDWWTSVVSPAVTHAAGTGVTVTAATDIEANFDATIAEVKTWITAYLATAPPAARLINNGAAVGCPTTIGATTTACSTVKVETSDPVVYQAFQLADLYAVSGGMSSRISVLPQIYGAALANQWENVDLKGGSHLRFAGVLSSYDACAPAGSKCTSVDPTTALALMNSALDARSTTASTVLPTVTDLTVS